MDLETGRAQFIELSGRFDLVKDDGSDNGANYWLNQGQKFLDARLGHLFPMVWMKVLTPGDHTVEVRRVKRIDTIYVLDPDSKSRTPLVRMTSEEFKDAFSHTSVQSSGLPVAYTVEAGQLSLDLAYDQSTVDDYSDGALILTAPRELKTLIHFGPKTDKAYEFYVIGSFAPPLLTEDTDRSFWTVNFSRLWLYASLYQLEVGYKNREAMSAWLTAIEIEEHEIIKDKIDLDLSDYDPVIEG